MPSFDWLRGTVSWSKTVSTVSEGWLDVAGGFNLDSSKSSRETYRWWRRMTSDSWRGRETTGKVYTDSRLEPRHKQRHRGGGEATPTSNRAPEHTEAERVHVKKRFVQHFGCQITLLVFPSVSPGCECWPVSANWGSAAKSCSIQANTIHCSVKCWKKCCT